MKIGVEMAYGFGDAVFMSPLIKKISEHYGTSIEIAVQQQCEDAFYNLPWVSKIHRISNLHDGMKLFKNYNHHYQLTPNVNFPRYKEVDQNHSLIDTALLTSKELGFGEINQKPILIFNQNDNCDINFTKPFIAIENVYKSGQSWANDTAFESIINKYQDKYDILWLSNSKPPLNVKNYANYTRRQLLSILNKAERFYCVGSGFFCGSLALEKRPKETICLWIDDYYKYEKRLSEFEWSQNIIWIHNYEELKKHLCDR